QGALRVRGDEAHVGGDGAHHHAASAGCARAACALSPQAPRARRAHPEEGARRLPQPHARDAFAPQAKARRTLAIAAAISGQKSSTSARVVIPPTSFFEKKMLMSPCETSIAWRNDDSAASPSTMA